MKKIIIVVIIVIIAALGFVTFKVEQDGFDIRLKNETNSKVSGLYITYDNIKSDIAIPVIASGDEYILNVNPEEVSNNDFNEAALKLEYKDYEGNLHTEYVIGYFEKGYSGKAIIKINSIDDNGKLEMEIKDNTSLY